MSTPNMIEIPAAWYGKDMVKDTSSWMYSLTPADIAELEAAAKSFKDSGLPLGLISRALFPLPEFGNFLRRLQTDLRKGKGFKLIRGLPVSRYNAEVYATIFCGIGSHLGSARSQNAAGHLLGHVRDIGADVSDPNTRIYQTTARQSFHTDSCDVVGLLCLKEAKEGGDSMLASSVTDYNEIAKRRPDLTPALFEPFATARRGERPEGQDTVCKIPVFKWHEGYLTCIYHRNYITAAQRLVTATK